MKKHSMLFPSVSVLWAAGLFIVCVLPACKNAPPPLPASIEKLHPDLDSILDESFHIDTLATGFQWSEGPLWLSAYNMLLFTDVPNNVVHSWTEKDGLKTWLKPSGYTGATPRGGEPGANGLALIQGDVLVLCQHGDRRVAAMNASLDDPKPDYVTLADTINGKRFNSPNDVAIGNNGDLYFTDPPYGLQGLDKDPEKEIPVNGVYRVSRGIPTLLIDSLTKPNGIAFLPGGNTFIVANSDPAKPIWYAFDLDYRGDIHKARIFYDATEAYKKDKGNPDGLKVDQNGHVFATGPGGIWIFNAQGTVLGKIRLHGGVSNCAFGADEKTLFVTNADKVLRIRLKK